MPAQFSINPKAGTITVQFLDGNGNTVAAPEGAQVEFESDNPAIGVAQDESNPLLGVISVAPDEGTQIATVSAAITNVNDVNGQPYDAVTVRVTHTPAKAASTTFQISN